jgi:RNA polymerase sigma-70 factor (ECF subfamily)
MKANPYPSLKENPENPFQPPSAEEANPERFVQEKELFIRKTFEQNPEKGVELLFKLYYRPLCSHAARFVYSRELAEDLVGEVFEYFWEKSLYQHVRTSFQAYLFTSVRHRAFQYLRSEFGKTRNDALQDIGIVSPAPNPHQLLQYDELYFQIEQLIQNLSPPVQRVFLMSRFEGKKNPVIAEELRISVKTVEAHITKVLHLLRKILGEQSLLGWWAVLLFITRQLG